MTLFRSEQMSTLDRCRIMTSTSQVLVLALLLSLFSIVSPVLLPKASAATVTATGTNPAVCNQTVSNSDSVVAYRLSGGDCVVEFKNSSSSTSWTTPAGVTFVSLLIVGGGGAGGFDGGGGGGGGGVYESNSVTVSPGSAYTVEVGVGGAAVNGYVNGASCNGVWNPTAVGCVGNPGGSSKFAQITVSGGGAGGGIESNGTADSDATALVRGGGGGAGGQNSRSGGNSPGNGATLGGSVVDALDNGGGGGGSSTNPGGNVNSTLAGNGGQGSSSSITGSTVVYGSGGAGGSFANSTRALGGTNAANGGTLNDAPTYPVANRGGGGGGGGNGNTLGNVNGTSGAAGIVVLRYTPTYVTATGTNPSICDQRVTNPDSVIAYRLPGGDCVVEFKRVGTTTWTIPSEVIKIDLLVVGGGGGGGSNVGAGGGGGGVYYTTQFSISGASSSELVVGDGGAGGTSPLPNDAITVFRDGRPGETSTATFSGVTITSGGGSGGQTYWGTDQCTGSNLNRVQASGGSVTSGGIAGPGGFGGRGSNGGASAGENGGAGYGLEITNNTLIYGAGGGGGGWAPYLGGTGGGNANSGAGNGGNSSVSTGTSGLSNRGGGGGGGYVGCGLGGSGGSGIIIIRYSPDLTGPTFSSASVTNSGTSLELVFNETLSANTAPANSFTVSRTLFAGTSDSITVSSASASGSTVTLNLASTVFAGDTVTVSYVDPSGSDDSNALQDLVGNDVATFSNQPVTNNSTVKQSQSPLTITSTTAAYGDDLTLTTSGGSGTGALTFDVDTGDCIIQGSTLFSSSVGSCTVTATKAADTNYLSESATAVITITSGSATLTIAFTSTTFTFGVRNAITVTVSAAGTVRFSANGRVIKNCKSISTIPNLGIASGGMTYRASCNYRPGTRGPLKITARLTPTDLNITPRTSTSAQFVVLRRTGVRG